MSEQGNELRSIRDLLRCSVHTQDGVEVRAHDLYFDDSVWTVRYLVVDLHGWPRRQRVLVPRVALGQPDSQHCILPIRLTEAQLVDCPGMDRDKPVCRQREYGLSRTWARWNLYWRGWFAPVPGMTALRPVDNVGKLKPRRLDEPAEDPHLRSAREVIGYHMQTNDGLLSNVRDLLVEPPFWVIRHLVVQTRSWWPGRKVTIPPLWVTAISWVDSSVYVNLSKERVRR